MHLKNNHNLIPTKAKYFCLCFFSCGISLFAQQHLDSISLDPVEKNLRLKNIEVAFTSPLFFTEAVVYLNSRKTPTKRVQSAESDIQYGFRSAGIFQAGKKILLSGALDVNRVDEKAVPYILTDERTDLQSFISNPSYFYAPRKSDWLKENYTLSAKLAYRPIKNITAVLGVDGNFLKAYSNSDPRPEIGSYRYLVEGKIGYTYRKHSLFAKGSYFNDKKESNITYDVSELNAPNYFDTYIRFNKGYGNYYYNNGYTNTEYSYSGMAYGAEYQFKSQNSYLVLGYDNRFYIDRMYWFYNQSLKDENNVPYYIRDKKKLTGLRSDNNVVYASYIGNFGEKKWSSEIIFKDTKDRNYDYQNLNTSYLAYRTNIDFSNFLSYRNSRSELRRIGLKANYGNQEIKDFSVVVHRKLQYLDLLAQFENEFKIKENQKISGTLLSGIYLPLRSLFDFQPYQGSANNIFVENIAKPDYRYDASKRINLGMELKYILDRKKIRYEAFVNSRQQFFIFKNKNYSTKSADHGDSDQFLNFGLNIRY